MTSEVSGGSWQLDTDRADLSRTVLREVPVPEPADGQALLRVDRVGVTANNVTYAVLGKAFRYWEFFPTEPGFGVVPLWGFAEVAASRAEGVRVGDRLYGYLPSASHLLVTPGRVDGRGFRDEAPHRTGLPSPYNAYALTSGDAAYQPDREDLQVLYRPLFWTSYLLADRLVDADLQPGEVVLLSSASSKTAYGAAFELRQAGREVVGLTSDGNVAFTEGLGCYDRVVSYDDVATLPAVPSRYVDVAGSTALLAALREHLGAALTGHVVVGVTFQELAPAGSLSGTGTAVFFAPDQMVKRIGDWGRDGFEQRFAAAWQRFAPVVEGWVDVTVGHGPQDLQRVWAEVQSGASSPRTGHVLQL